MTKQVETKTGTLQGVVNHFKTEFPNFIRYFNILVMLCLGVLGAIWIWPQIFEGSSLSAMTWQDYLALTAQIVGGIVALFATAHFLKGGLKLFKGMIPETGDESVSWPFIAYIAFLVIAAAVSAYTTFYGLQSLFFDESEGIFRFYILPVVISVGSFFFILWAWGKPAHVMDKVGPWKKLYLLFVYAPIAGVFILGISTMTSVIGIGGDDTVKYHLTQTLETYEQSLDEIKRFREQELPLAETTKLYGERFNGMASEERATGRLTGVTGGGAVTRYLEGLGDYALRMNSTIIQSNQEADIKFNTLNMMLTNLRAELEDGALDRGFAERMREFRERFNELRGLMIKMAEESPLPAIRAQAADGQVLNPRTALSSHDAGLAAKQERMISELQMTLDRFSERLTEQLDSLDKREIPVVPKFEQVSLYESVVRYWHQVPMVWLLALAMDFGAYVALLLAAVIGSANIREPHIGKKDVAGKQELSETATT